jgi:hypothetical protein
MVITSEEYNVRFKSYLKEVFDKLEVKPSGMFGQWSFAVATEREFKQTLAEQGIVVDKEHVRSYN